MAYPHTLKLKLNPQDLPGELSAVEADPHASNCALVGCAASGAADAADAPAGGIASVDLDAGRVTGRGTLDEAAVLLRAPAGRGLVAVGTAGGGVLLVDPRTGFGVEAALSAHGAGLAALDARGDLLATAGFGLRQGAVVADTYVKVPSPSPPCPEVGKVRALSHRVGLVKTELWQTDAWRAHNIICGQPSRWGATPCCMRQTPREAPPPTRADVAGV